MHEFPAGALAAPARAGLAGAVAGDAMADLVEAAELLDVEMDEFARMLALVAAHGFGGLESLEAAQAGGGEDAADGGGRDPDGLGDVGSREPVAPQRDHLMDDDLGVGRRSLLGRDERSASPAVPSLLKRASHLWAVRTICARPIGVSRAF